MEYYSTRDASLRCSLKEAAIMGLAPDGGLFMPERIPSVDLDEVMSCGTFPEMSARLAALFFDEYSYEELLEMTTRAFPFDIPMTSPAPGLDTLELFHGPTFAFKDVGAGFMGRMMGRLADKDRTINVIAATSGDTGSAVANGFYKVDGVNVTILFPKGKISPFQESQMTTLGENIHAVAVDGCFDDCQAIVKKLLSDKDFHDTYRLTSANSINILRWIPQSFFYFWGYRQWMLKTGRKDPVVIVPSGNLGNLASGVLARRMGLPIKAFIAANNSNDTFARYLATGVCSPEPTVPTVANAMDVSLPSNFERIMSFYSSDWNAVRRDISGCSFTDDEIRSAIKEMSDEYSYLSCPHSATGYLAASRSGADGFWLSTAHYAKFCDVVSRSIGTELPLPEPFRTISLRKGKAVESPADADAVKEIIISSCSGRQSTLR
ncbi:MAG: threonine synthase [Bacteroidales bacterium]|nr:threonine synthase [Bacteroidales bacterium]